MSDTQSYGISTGTLITRTDFEHAIDDPYLRTLRLLFVAIPLGPIMFVIALLVMSQTWLEIEPRRSEIELMSIMSVFHAVFATITLLVSEMVFRTMMNLRRLRKDPGESTHVLAVRCANRYRMASIARFAVLEIAAMVGLGICAIGVTRGVMNAEPIYWVNVFSTMIMVGIAVWRFPSRDRLIRSLQESCNQ